MAQIVEGTDILGARILDHMQRGHALARRVKRNLPDARVCLFQFRSLRASLRGGHDQRNLRRIAHHPVGVPLLGFDALEFGVIVQHRDPERRRAGREVGQIHFLAIGQEFALL